MLIRIPTEYLKKYVIIKNCPKRDITVHSSNRGITLLSVSGRVFYSFILKRFLGAIESRLRENQADDRPKSSCTDQIFTLRQITESAEYSRFLSKSTLSIVKKHSIFFIMNRCGMSQECTEYLSGPWTS